MFFNPNEFEVVATRVWVDNRIVFMELTDVLMATQIPPPLVATSRSNGLRFADKHLGRDM